MTMPHERTRALLWAKEFLQDIRSGKLTPEEAARQAHVILRHYPASHEVDHLARLCEHGSRGPGGSMLSRVVDGEAVDSYKTKAISEGETS